ncbi:hypothetical protein FACS189499_08340 [Clostridia bacterium]|nr:hypothetical protein FACS189499_08340 [Clostridia bacterium]
MNIDEILESIDDIVDNAPQIPLTNKKCAVNGEDLRELVKEMRLRLPNEIMQAKNIVNDRKRIIDDAHQQAESIIKRADERANRMTSQQEIRLKAEQQANEIMQSAQKKSRNLLAVTNENIDSILKNTEEALSDNLMTIKKARAAIKGK